MALLVSNPISWSSDRGSATDRRLYEPKLDQALGGSDNRFLIQPRRPAEDAPGLLAGGVSDLAEQRQKLSHGWISLCSEPNRPVRQLKSRHLAGGGAKAGFEHAGDIKH